jgi:NTP pyrophosphatase (non-canonical NTP hydrolase)
MKFNEYQTLANDLCSTEFYGDDFELAVFTDLVDDAAAYCSMLDHYKRALFYSNRDKYALDGKDPIDLPEQSDRDVVHSIVGILSETGELGEAFVSTLDGYRNGQGFNVDTTNFVEELGDLLWYIALGARAANTTLEAIAQKNIDKLHTRYKEKTFSEHDALNRDLEAEKAVLES